MTDKANERNFLGGLESGYRVGAAMLSHMLLTTDPGQPITREVIARIIGDLIRAADTAKTMKEKTHDR